MIINTYNINISPAFILVLNLVVLVRFVEVFRRTALAVKYSIELHECFCYFRSRQDVNIEIESFALKPGKRRRVHLKDSNLL